MITKGSILATPAAQQAAPVQSQVSGSAASTEVIRCMHRHGGWAQADGPCAWTDCLKHALGLLACPFCLQLCFIPSRAPRLQRTGCAPASRGSGRSGTCGRSRRRRRPLPAGAWAAARRSPGRPPCCRPHLRPQAQRYMIDTRHQARCCQWDAVSEAGSRWGGHVLRPIMHFSLTCV